MTFLLKLAIYGRSCDCSCLLHVHSQPNSLQYNILVKDVIIYRKLYLKFYVPVSDKFSLRPNSKSPGITFATKEKNDHSSLR